MVPLDSEVIEYIAGQIVAYIAGTNYRQVVLLEDDEVWGKEVVRACRRICGKKGIVFASLRREGVMDKILVERILAALKLGE